MCREELLEAREGNVPQFFINEKTQMKTLGQDTKEQTFFFVGKNDNGGGVSRYGGWCPEAVLCWCGKVTGVAGLRSGLGSVWCYGGRDS